MSSLPPLGLPPNHLDFHRFPSWDSTLGILLYFKSENLPDLRKLKISLTFIPQNPLACIASVLSFTTGSVCLDHFFSSSQIELRPSPWTPMLFHVKLRLLCSCWASPLPSISTRALLELQAAPSVPHTCSLVQCASAHVTLQPQRAFPDSGIGSWEQMELDSQVRHGTCPQWDWG